MRVYAAVGETLRPAHGTLQIGDLDVEPHVVESRPLDEPGVHRRLIHEVDEQRGSRSDLLLHGRQVERLEVDE